MPSGIYLFLFSSDNKLIDSSWTLSSLIYSTGFILIKSNNGIITLNLIESELFFVIFNVFKLGNIEYVTFPSYSPSNLGSILNSSILFNLFSHPYNLVGSLIILLFGS